MYPHFIVLLIILILNRQVAIHAVYEEVNVKVDGINSYGEGRVTHVSFTGWRNLAHSYALVCQHMILQFLRLNPNGNLRLSFSTVPRPYQWKLMNGLFNAEDELTISSIPTRDPSDIPDIELRFGFPIDLSNTNNMKIVTFATAEYEVAREMLTSWSPPWNNPDNIMIMTPSHWSATLMKELAGVPEKNLFILPHGFDPRIYYPRINSTNDDDCIKFRERLGVPSDAFVYLHVSAGTPNKNIKFIVSSFKRVRRLYPTATLVIKLLSDLYDDSVQRILSEISMHSFEKDELIMFDSTVSNSFMGQLFRCSEVYVSPYSSEGFNMPVLESLASGVPVIVSAGGSTDDFTNEYIARYVTTTVRNDTTIRGDRIVSRRSLTINTESLYQEMLFVIEDYYKLSSDNTSASWFKAARKLAAEYALENYTWDAIGLAFFNYVMGKTSILS